MNALIGTVLGLIIGGLIIYIVEQIRTIGK